ncbi:dihydrolipoyl dehydrogenase family protein [Methanocella arvoryzae]|uniref:Pyruvate dehydrogenase complex E3,dihydrolipoamide dehydrogenase n=1 Tax=Methanocella arvoryzae (strain DSM 22066 / NBRC 105507 / MRE50) TaxID=351160 RepID=Q0W154_METAR|nr:NAD(P)/FAD-dependent oxidoreductase [Methanocella arvoryzae]CAJ37889.1 pyruvate dehydrogenase complex E3,dihydrolipoamide dehydrogenase [Methanocella arvoryzae MRE50]
MVVGDIEVGTDVLVIGAGPAGYTAAIRLGQMGMDVTLVGPEIGGICLNHGCIPVKGIVRTLDLVADVTAAEARGIKAHGVEVDLNKVQAWNAQVIRKLQAGIRSLLNASGVQLFEGTCSFTSSTTAVVRIHGSTQHIRFRKAVIATGMHYIVPEGIRPDGRRIIFPHAVAHLHKVPGTAVILGGGIDGATMASLLAKMGTRVTLAYKSASLVPAIDDDVLQPAMKSLADLGVQTFPQASWEVHSEGGEVVIRSGNETTTRTPDLILICSPTKANVQNLSLDRTKVRLTDKGFVEVDDRYRTADPSIYAIGDVLGGRRNASVAFRDGLSVANIIAGKPGLPDYQAMTLTIEAGLDIASAGMGEKEAKKAGIDVTVSRSPYSANGGAATYGKQDGFIKVVAEKQTGRILGTQIVGPRAGDLIGEALLAIEMGARLEDVALTLHPHPELNEIFADACARAAGLSANVVKK